MPQPIRQHFVAATTCDPLELFDELVSVVIPAYNAASTIGATLHSVRGQLHRNLEILVVDDGSVDDTAAVVRAHATKDARVRLITIPNSGVAAARNAGIAQAKGRLIAPIDADDLWSPSKVCLQLRAFRDGGERIGLVYTWYKVIDARDRVIMSRPTPEVCEDILPLMAVRNFVGNGSSPMIRRDAILAVGGYDESLRSRNAQGCEDWKLYFELAERWDFAVVPDYLTAYRQIPGNMSGDALRMLRSWDLCEVEFRSRRPELKAQFHAGRSNLLRLLLHRSIRQRQSGVARRLLMEIFSHDQTFGVFCLAALPLRACNFIVRRTRRVIDWPDTYWDNK